MKLVRFTLLIIHIGVVGLLLGCLLNAFIPPKIFGALNFLSLAFPGLMIAHILLTFIWIISWKKRTVFFILISVLFFKPVTRWINYSPKVDKQGALKVLTFNGRNGKYGNENIKEYMEKLDADIVIAQEYTMNESNEQTIDYSVVTLKTKHKILAKGLIDVPSKNSQTFYADIRYHGKTIRIINVYLEPFYLEKSMVKPTDNQDVNEQKAKILISKMIPTFKMHQEQVDEIKKFADQSPYPVIIGGDFNAVPNSYEYYHISKGLTDAFEAVGRGSGTSFHDYKIPIRIDYLFSSKTIKPITYRVDRSVKISDHFPVIATFDVE